jgi:hypothetical protein
MVKLANHMYQRQEVVDRTNVRKKPRSIGAAVTDRARKFRNVVVKVPQRPQETLSVRAAVTDRVRKFRNVVVKMPGGAPVGTEIGKSKQNLAASNAAKRVADQYDTLRKDGRRRLGFKTGNGVPYKDKFGSCMAYTSISFEVQWTLDNDSLIRGRPSVANAYNDDVQKRLAAEQAQAADEANSEGSKGDHESAADEADDLSVQANADTAARMIGSDDEGSEDDLESAADEADDLSVQANADTTARMMGSDDESEAFVSSHKHKKSRYSRHYPSLSGN